MRGSPNQRHVAESAVAVRANPAADGTPQVTRDVEPEALRGLMDDPPRATVAFADGDAVELLPARVGARVRVQLFGVLPGGSPDLDGREVVLLMDGGSYWFELRGVSVRGVATRAEPGGEGLCWYAIAPSRVMAWDYATVRET